MCRGFIKGSFVMPLGGQTAMFAEIMGLILVVELASLKEWFSFGLKLILQSLFTKLLLDLWMFRRD